LLSVVGAMLLDRQLGRLSAELLRIVPISQPGNCTLDPPRQGRGCGHLPSLSGLTDTWRAVAGTGRASPGRVRTRGPQSSPGQQPAAAPAAFISAPKMTLLSRQSITWGANRARSMQRRGDLGA
jgi:hypothetical protein